MSEAIEIFRRIEARRELTRQQDAERERLLAPILDKLRLECPQIFRTDAEMAEIRAALSNEKEKG